MISFRSSQSQQRIWRKIQASSCSFGKKNLPYYNIPLILQTDSWLVPDYIRKALLALSARHEVLRTNIVEEGCEVIQKIVENIDIQLQIYDWSENNASDREVFLYLQKKCKSAFMENSCNSLIEAFYLKRDGNRSVLMLVIHRCICDLTSLTILKKDFINFYTLIQAGREPVFDEVPLQYADFSEWQNELDDEIAESEYIYWNRKLNENFPIYDLMAEKKKGNGCLCSCKELELVLDSNWKKSLEAFIAVYQYSEKTVLLAIFKILILLLTNEMKIGLMTSIEERADADLSETVGPIANLSYLYDEFEENRSFLEIVKQVNETYQEALDHNTLPFERLIKMLKGSDTVFDEAVSQIYFNYSPADMDSGDHVFHMILKNLGWGDYDYNLLIKDDICNIHLYLTYNSEYYNESMALSILNSFKNIGSELLKNPEAYIGDIKLINEKEHALLDQFNNTAVNYNRNITVVQLFEANARKLFHEKAIISNGQSLTYGELNGKSNTLAYKLRQMGVKPDDFVAIITDSKIESIIGFLGVIKAGGAYVPIDPLYPEERISYILRDCKPKAILCKNAPKEMDIPVIDITKALLWDENPENLPSVNVPGDLIYLIYTSGTTGVPKGTMIEHKSVIRLVHKPSYVKLNEGTRLLQTGSLSFDAATFEIWGILMNGGRLYLANNDIIMDPQALKQAIEESHINMMWLTVSLFNQLVSMDVTVFDNMEMLLIGGEKVSESHIKRLLESNKRIRLLNGYGPTETTTFAATYPIEISCLENRVPIGYPITNTKIYILKKMQLCGIGMTGELCIAGDGVARGYLNNPDLTNQKFIDNPYGDGKLYRSGDLARWRPDGSIEFLGRIDDQVKLRGFRIELSDIERVILQEEGIRDAAVAVRELKGEKNLCVFLTANQEISRDELRASLKKKLPDYMIPAFVMQIDKIPLNRNGKLDEKALPPISISGEKKYIAPGNERELLVTQIFQEVLGMDKVGIEDNFFDLGGHSLKAIAVINEIEKRTGTRISFKRLFDEPTVKNLAAMILNLTEKDEIIPKCETTSRYLMSSAQKRIYTICGYEDTGIAYNISMCLEMKNPLEYERVNLAYLQLIERHEALRTSFCLENGQSYQVIAGDVNAEAELTEADSLDYEGKMRLVSEFVRPFDLGKAPLLRIKLVKCTNGHDLLLFDMHHIVADGMSITIITDDFINLYLHNSVSEPDLQYRDYSEWMRKRDLSNQEAYWIKEIKGLTALELPLDYSRPVFRSFRGKCIEFPINETLRHAISSVSRELGITEYVFFISAAMILLSKYSRQESIVVGTPVSGRVRKEIERTVGMFVNTLVITGYLEGSRNLKDFLMEMKAKCLEAQENQEYPFETLVEKAGLERDASRNPLFDVVFNYQNIVSLSTDRLDYDVIDVVRKVSKFDLTITVNDYDDRNYLVFEYAADLFKGNTIRQMGEHYLNILGNMCICINQCIDDIRAIGKNELYRLMTEFNQTDTAYPKDRSVKSLFEETVSRFSHKVAVVSEDKTITYQELNSSANQLAGYLKETGVRTGDCVAVIADRNIETIIGICAIVKVGGIYVPIDTSYPEERVQYIINDCKPKMILTDREKNIFSIPAFHLAELRNLTKIVDNPETHSASNDLIYIMYTSGTTGKPKGVMIRHKSVMRLVRNTNYITLDDTTVILQTGSMAFDAATFEIWGALLNGGELHLEKQEIILNPDSMKSQINDKKINTMFLTVSLFNQLTDLDITIFDRLNTLIIGGEKVSEIHIGKLLSHNSHIHLNNAYGPTETTTFATTHEVTEKDLKGTIPIGRPISNTKVYVMNKDKLCGIGIPGEVCIAGDGVAAGYLNQPELSQEKFVNNPFDSGKLYRTGDLARWLSDGELIYMGRIDEQVKLRGYRIELEEIESALRKLPGIRDAVVTLSEKGGKHLCAYFIANEKKDITRIKEQMRKELPEYMVPPAIMQISKIPVSTNGKTDRKALPDISIKSESNYLAPHNKIEATAAGIFEEILGVDKIGMNDNFYELGGDSIKAIRVVSRMRELKYELAIRDIMQERVIGTIITKMKKIGENSEFEQGEITGEVPLTPIQKSFFSWNLRNPSHFNQSVMLKYCRRFDKSVLKEVLSEIIAHHDMLRVVYSNSKQKILSIKDRDWVNILEFDLSDRSDKEFENVVFEKGTIIQKGMDLVNGPLIKTVIFRTHESDYLMICIHHLIVDGISWRILIEDIINGYVQYERERKITLPKKTASYLTWSKSLLDYSSSEELQKEIPYWNSINQSIAELSLDGDIESHDANDGEEQITIMFSREQTEKLLYEAGNAFHTEINDLLLTALGHAFYKWCKKKKIGLHLEGHGREKLNKDIETDRTVGWFTSVYPVIVEVSESIENSIIQTKEMLRRIPQNGIGYGIIQYRGTCKSEEKVDLCFNYLGQWNNETYDTRDITITDVKCGPNIAAENKLNNSITFNSQIMEGVLTVSIIYDKGKYSASVIRKLGCHYEKALNEIIDICVSKQEEIRTASDYGAEVTDDILNEIVDLF